MDKTGSRTKLIDTCFRAENSFITIELVKGYTYQPVLLLLLRTP